MKYVLLNRKNIVVDVLEDTIRYLKLQPSGITVACEEDEGKVGVIGSDANTHYQLIDADTQNNPNAVRVMRFDEIPSDVRPNLAHYDAENGVLVCDLENAKLMKQEENKLRFAEYLATHPLTWVDGKQYGVTLEDQSEISLNINQYQVALQAGVEKPTLEWHARQEGCTPWPVEQLVALSLAISEAVYPQYRKMNQYKTSIFSAENIEALEAIELNYNDEAEVSDE